MHTSVIDEGIDVPWTGLDLLESLLDRLVTGEIDLDRFNGVGRLWTLLVEGLDRKLGLLQRTTAEKNMVGVIGLQKRLDGLVADASIASSDEDNLWGRHL